MRKNTASSALLASMLRIHRGNSPSAEIVPPTAAKNITSATRRTRRDDDSRKYFNLHLLRTNIVSNILGGDGQLVSAGNGLVRNPERASIRRGLRVPAQR